MPEQSKRGYLVLADISGYTSFLAKVELEHAHEILTDLLEVIVERFQSLLTISKLEGDAVFAYVGETKISRGEILLELIESTYTAFRQRRDTSNRSTTCSCKACQSMPSLELKFFVHCGSFIVQHVAGIQELVGSDVNLAHRLMKNHVTEHTGWKAYSLFTKYAMECLGLKIDDVHDQIESYEHLGDIATVTINLLPRYEALAASRQYYFSDNDVDITVPHEFNVSDVELWQILTSTEILTAMMENTKWLTVNLPGGRTGVGAQNHCLHGKGVMRLTIVDWHPFTYFTAHGIDGRQKFYQMYEIKPFPDNAGSILYWRWKADMGLPRWLGKIMGATVGKMIGIQFCKMVENYIANAQKPTFLPETE
ncbi:MAG TPA: DUF2652 domain-containing protein [Anaerolineales bacterium]|nr:DUF2652 domain-containing protein [Anaerolineales bacterium]